MKLVNRAHELLTDIDKMLDNGTIEPFEDTEWLLIDCKDIILKLVDENSRLTDKIIDSKD
jgi:ribosomal silencing factor RsfS